MLGERDFLSGFRQEVRFFKKAAEKSLLPSI